MGEKRERHDLLEAEVTNWGSGTDDGSGSNFRNFEFESHVALRFIEEGFDVDLLTDEGQAEMIVDETFAIECKRPTRWKGLFTNALKSRKQIGKSGHPGVLIFNLDDLEDYHIDRSSSKSLEESFEELSRAAEHGLGGLDSPIFCVVLEYVDDKKSVSKKGSFVHAFHNCTGKELVERSDWFRTVSVGFTGDTSLTFDLRSPKLPKSERFDKSHDASDTAERDQYFDSVINV